MLMKNKFTLSNPFLIGHKQIDAEHEGLVDIINEMVDSVSAGDLKRSERKWRQFQEALIQHFANEDIIMNSLNYVEESHERFHEEVQSELKKHGKDCKSIEDWEQCLHSILDTLVVDILKHDLNFAAHLQKINFKNK